MTAPPLAAAITKAKWALSVWDSVPPEGQEMMGGPNAVEYLRSLLSALAADDRLAKAAPGLRRFVRHNERCRVWAPGAPSCDCGLAAALAAFDAAVRGDAVEKGEGR